MTGWFIVKLLSLRSIHSASRVTLADVFPADWWLTAYYETKWRGFVFCPPKENIRKATYDATVKVLKRVYKIELEPMAKILAKI